MRYRNRCAGTYYCQRPELLRAFGWQVIAVLSKDWFASPELVMERIERALSGVVEEEPTVEENPLVPELCRNG